MCKSGKKTVLTVVRILVASLVLAVMAGTFSLISMPSYAADGDKTIQLVNNGTVAGIQGKQMSNVYFGNYKQSSDGEGGFKVEPIKWRVLQNADGRLFILTDKNIDAAKPHNATGDATWETLALRKFLNGYGDYSNKDNFIGTAFTDLERESIAVSHIETPVNPKTGTIGGNPTDDKVFLLSIQEARNTSFGFNWDLDANDEGRKSENTDYTNTNGIYLGDEPDNRWFLRTMGSGADFLSYVRPAGSISYNGVGLFGFNESFTRAWPFRSACRVELGSVLFTSAAVDGKISGNTGAGALKAIEAYDGNDWKLTVRDTARKFKVTETEAACCVNEKVELHYTGAEVFDAETAPYEYISAIIVNKSGEALYYGRISQPTAAEGKIELNVPRTLDAGTYDLKVFSEQYNGDRKTDYASEMSDISLTVSEPLVPYVNDAGRKQEPKVCKVVAAERETLSSDLSEWYAAVEDVSVTKPVVINGNVNLILCDGVEFNAPFGIMINKSSSLTIWAQSMGAEAGTIDTTSKIPIIRAGIGFDTSDETGTLVINGGRIIAKGNMGSAGIGGSFTSVNGGNVEINGGKVTAEGSKYILNYAEAIGHGENGIISGDLNLGRVKVSVDGGRTYVECDDRISSCRVKGKVVLVERCSGHEFEDDVCRYCGAGRPVRIDDESNDLQVTLGKQLTYNGKEQTQTVAKITLNGIDITDCCDISDNVQRDVGEYELTITADPECGYEGNVTRKFTIKEAPPKPDDGEADDAVIDDTIPVVNINKTNTVGNFKKRQMKIVFPANRKVDVYRIQYRLAGKKTWTNGWSQGTGTYTVKNLKKYSLCEFRIAGYVRLEDGTWVRGKWSKISYRYVNSVSLKKVSGGKRSIKVAWSKDGKGNGYRIQYSLKKSMTGLKTVKVNSKSSTKRTIKKLKKGKTYYIRMRPVKKRAGKVYLGILGATKKARVK